MQLVRVNIQDAEKLWKMQITAFQDLYAYYHDIETSPATETLEKNIIRLEQLYTYCYYIKVEGSIVGAVRIVDTKNPNKYKRISPIFIMKNRIFALRKELFEKHEEYSVTKQVSNFLSIAHSHASSS